MKITLGADPKRAKALGGLVVILLGVLWYNSSSSPDIPAGKSAGTPARASGPRTSPVSIAPRAGSSQSAGSDASRPQTRAQQARISGAGRGSLEEFRPSLKPKRGEEAIDLTRVDPTLKFDRLARLQNVSAEGAMRSLFDFGAAPIPTVDPIKLAPRNPHPFMGPELPKPPAPTPAPVKVPPPPIPLKFYGYLASPRGGPERGFFLDGDEIIIGTKDELMRGKYKVVRVGRTSAEVEDVPNKNKQTLPLVQEGQG